jgi:hypothetical protein
MNKICRNAKNYKLTEGQEYEILQEENGYVRIINDSGKNVRYDSSLFEESEELIPMEAIPERTEQDCINSISYNGTTLSYTDINENFKQININLYLNSNNSFSCGINRIEGVNNLCDYLENEEFVETENDDFIELKKALFRTVFNYWSNRPLKGMWMCSTNQDGNNEDYHNLLTELSTHDSGWFLNPNSSNQIKLWYGIINQ